MEDIQKRQIIQQAQAYWQSGQTPETGILLFERISKEFRPIWGADILETVCEYVPPASEVQAVLALARMPDWWGQGKTGKWREAHMIVDTVNDLHYQIQEPLLKSVYTLAKDIAKVIYNAYWYPAPFDHSAGWEIAVDLKAVIDLMGNAEFAEKGWASLCNEKYIGLDTPALCCPGCPVCYTFFASDWDRDCGVVRIGEKMLSVNRILEIAGFAI